MIVGLDYRTVKSWHFRIFILNPIFFKKDDIWGLLLIGKVACDAGGGLITAASANIPAVACKPCDVAAYNIPLPLLLLLTIG